MAMAGVGEQSVPGEPSTVAGGAAGATKVDATPKALPEIPIAEVVRLESPADLAAALDAHAAWIAGVLDPQVEVARGRANFHKLDLRPFNLRGVNLSGANLSGANLEGVDLGGANLTVTNLAGANLRRAKLDGAKLARAKLDGADLHEADLTGAVLTGVDLTKAHGAPHLPAATEVKADLPAPRSGATGTPEVKVQREPATPGHQAAQDALSRL